MNHRLLKVIDNDNIERILIPISNTETIEELISLSTIIKSKKNNKRNICP